MDPRVILGFNPRTTDDEFWRTARQIRKHMNWTASLSAMASLTEGEILEFKPEIATYRAFPFFLSGSVPAPPSCPCGNIVPAANFSGSRPHGRRLRW